LDLGEKIMNTILDLAFWLNKNFLLGNPNDLIKKKNYEYYFGSCFLAE